ncbi:unnamed protein product [Amaranthus hypochondriacus]
MVQCACFSNRVSDLDELLPTGSRLRSLFKGSVDDASRAMAVVLLLCIIKETPAEVISSFGCGVYCPSPNRVSKL